MRKKLLVFMSMVLMLSFSTQGLSAQTDTQKDYFNLIDNIIESETKFGLSGAQLTVMHKGEIVHSKGYGYTNSYANITDADGEIDLKGYELIPRENRTPVTTETMFDLASNTKMYGLIYGIQKLVQDGDLALDDKIVDIFPDFKNPVDAKYPHQEEITIEDVLMHTAGFVTSPKYHDNTIENPTHANPNEPDGTGTNHLYTQDRDELLGIILDTPLIRKPKEKHVYSDTDYMLLGYVIEEITGQRLDVYMNENFYKPLGLNRIAFNPLENGFTLEDTVASELHGNTRDGLRDFNNGRKKVVHGEVHDEKAFHSLAGIAGHAGLFANTEDIVKLASKMFDGSLFTEETVNKFTEPSDLNDTYARGWRRQGKDSGYGFAFSPYASENTIGHTGWTGTVTVIDPDNDVVIALFTNARNTPVMRPSSTLYTNSFNTNGYGSITTLVYEALGLGSGKAADQALIDLFETTLAKADKDSDVSKRNAIRAQISALENELKTSQLVSEYYESDIVQDTIKDLEEFKELDFKHLSNPEVLRIGHTKLENLYLDVIETEEKYTDKTWDTFKAALTKAELVLENVDADQVLVDAAYNELSTSFNALEEKVVITGPEEDQKHEIPPTGIGQPYTWGLLASGSALAFMSYAMKDDRKRKYF